MFDTETLSPSAITAPNLFVETDGRTLAYRRIGTGRPLLLCMRFRGTMDLWDPAFVDTLAANGFEVIPFDYTGLGQSTGTPDYNPLEMAKDIRDLIAALDLQDVVVGAWSLGGLAAQAALALYPDRISHMILIGTNPAGTNILPGEQRFYDLAGIEHYTLDDETGLFFEPASEASRVAAARSAARIAARTQGRSPPVPIEFARERLKGGPTNAPFPAPFVFEALKNSAVPVLHIGGDHDIIFPVENWYALNRQLPKVSLITFPDSGHGPHHQYPEVSADLIASFVRNT